MIIDKKYNYVYRITNTEENKHYIGVRSCNEDPYLDIGYKYKSTTKNEYFHKDQRENPQNYIYQILEFFTTRLEANAREVDLHKIYNVGCNESFYNDSNQTSKFFDITGNRNIANKISKANKGRIIINNGVDKKCVKPNDLKLYLEKGFVMGGLKYTDDQKKNLVKVNLGKIYINNTDIETMIYPEEYNTYKERGYILGRLPMKEISKFKLSLSHSGKILTDEHKLNIGIGTLGLPKSETMKNKLSETRTGMIYINNNIIEKIIKPYELYEYIQDNWVEGKLPMPENHKKAIAKGSLGKPGTINNKIRINNGDIEKFINTDELETYINLGWLIGNKLTRKKIDYSNRKGTTTGKIGINNGIKNKFIFKEELDNYIQDGWIRGLRSTKNKKD